MLRPLIGALVLAALPVPAKAHALFPGNQTVQTATDRAFARFQAVNGRRDVTEFVVEVFDMDWKPSRIAVASPSRLRVPYHEADDTQSGDKPFSVLISLDGQREQRLRVCTRSVPPASASKVAVVTRVNTRVCATVTVRKFGT